MSIKAENDNVKRQQIIQAWYEPALRTLAKLIAVREQNLRKIKHRRLKPDGVEQFFLGHEAIHQRLTRGLIDRIDHAEKEGQNRYMPKLNKVELNEKPVNDRLNHGERLSDHQHPPAIEAICDGAPDRADQKPRQSIEERNDPDRDGRARDMPHQPALRHVLHKIARAGDQRAFQKEPEISMPQRSQGS